MPRVLLVTSQPQLRTLLEKRFLQEGFDVVLNRFEEGAPPDLIILGQEVGGANELDRAARVAPGVPVIVLTTGEASAALPLDAAQLRMPFRPSQLLALARKAVAQG
jgi:DNA-binding response OmpR family regulator